MVGTNFGVHIMQIIGIVFGLVMMYLTFLHYKRNEFKVEVFLLWVILWLGFIVIVISPTILDFMVKGLRMGRRLDFFVIFGFLILTSIVYYNYLIVNSTRRRVEKIVRNIAIDNNHKRKK
jgi:hypothetical protein